MPISHPALFRSFGISFGVMGVSLLLLAAGVADDARWEHHQSALKQQLKPGRQRDFYAQKLGELGYAITAINAYGVSHHIGEL